MITITIYLVVMVGVTAAVWKSPGAILGLGLCTFAFNLWAYGTNSWFVQHSQINNFVTAALILLALVRASATHGYERLLQFDALTLSVFVLFGWCYASYAWAFSPSITKSIFATNTPRLLLIAFVMPLAFNTFKDARSGLACTMVLAGITVVLLATMIEWDNRRASIDGTRIGSPLAAASVAGIALLLPFLVRFSRKLSVTILVRSLLCIASLYLLYVSQTRGQFVAAALLLIIMYPLSRGGTGIRSFVIAASSLVFVAVIFAIFFYFAGEEDSRWDAGTFVAAYSHSRSVMSEIMLEAWSEAGILVHLFGFGSATSWDPQFIGIYPHVVVVEVLTELGIVGLCFLLWVWALFYIRLHRMYKAPGRTLEDRSVVLALGALFSFYLIISFKQGSLQGHCEMYGIACIVGRLTRSDSLQTL